MGRWESLQTNDWFGSNEALGADGYTYFQIKINGSGRGGVTDLLSRRQERGSEGVWMIEKHELSEN